MAIEIKKGHLSLCYMNRKIPLAILIIIFIVLLAMTSCGNSNSEDIEHEKKTPAQRIEDNTISIQQTLGSMANNQADILIELKQLNEN